MLCIKTGFVATVAGYRLRGDAFVFDNFDLGLEFIGETVFNEKPHNRLKYWLLLRVVGVRTSEEDWNDFGQINHIEAETYDHWFDEGNPTSTLILAPHTWKWLGYNGQPAKE